jgi:hypothetical protein
MTSLLQKINELDLRIDNISTSGGGGTTDTTALQNQIDINTSDISALQTNKQNTLIPGDNISITNNVISTKFKGFRAIGTSNITQTINNNTQFSIKFTNTNTEYSYDTDNLFNTSNGKFTADVAGYWSLSYQLWMTDGESTNNNVVEVRLTRNGGSANIMIQVGQKNGQIEDLNTIIRLQQGDILELYKAGGFSTTMLFNTFSAFFECRYIAPI